MRAMIEKGQPLDPVLVEKVMSQQTSDGRTDPLDLKLGGQLPRDVRLCIVLAYSEGMSHAEISQTVHMPLGTAKSHITRGSARLRELLHAYGDADVR